LLNRAYKLAQAICFYSLCLPFKTPQKVDKPAAGKGHVVQRILDADENDGATEVVDDIAQDTDVYGKHLVHYLSVIECG
jgi:hypothetical protein